MNSRFITLCFTSIPLTMNLRTSVLTSADTPPPPIPPGFFHFRGNPSVHHVGLHYRYPGIVDRNY